MRSSWARALIITGVALACSPASGQQKQKSALQPNILVIVLDDVGIDKLRIYGQTESPTYAAAPYCGTLADPLAYPRTPNIERLAAGRFPGLVGGGIRFDRAYGGPVCSPARACLQTGRYGFRTGLGVVDDGEGYRKRMSNAEVQLPELLTKGFAAPSSPGALQRYRTGAFGKWHMSALPVCDPVRASDFAHPVANGFQLFQGTMGNVGTTGSNPGDHYNWTKVTAVPGTTELTRYEVGDEFVVEPFQFSSQCGVPGSRIEVVGHSEETYAASVTRQDAVQWINAQTQPYFAYVSFNAPHFPYQVPPLSLLSEATQSELSNAGNCGGPYCAGQVAGQASPCGTSTCGDLSACTTTQRRVFYNAMLEAVDTEIGNLLQGISPEQRANTMVFLVSDNGTPGAVIEDSIHDPTHGKGQIYELGVRAPMITAGYLVPPGAHTTEALVHVVDLWRTLAQISGASETRAAPLQPLDSISFQPLLADPSGPSLRTEVFCQGFAFPGRYEATEWGPYEEGCPDLQVPALFACSPRDLGAHGRSLSDGTYKLILIQTLPGIEVTPSGSQDIRPEYSEFLFDLVGDPAESVDLMPLVPSDPGLAAIHDALRDRLTVLSGY